MRNHGYLRNYASTIRLLAGRGHQVIVGSCGPNDTWRWIRRVSRGADPMPAVSPSSSPAGRRWARWRRWHTWLPGPRGPFWSHMQSLIVKRLSKRVLPSARSTAASCGRCATVLSVEKGQILGIIGPNGAGKTTLLKVLSRVTPPTEGRVVGTGRVVPLLALGAGFQPDLSGRENMFLNAADARRARRQKSRPGWTRSSSSRASATSSTCR